MSSKKKPQLTKHCRIFQWIEAQDSDFAGAIRDLCLEGALSPGGRSAGVTFLYPKEKAYRQEVIDKTYSDDADEAEKIVQSLIIPDALISSADFNRRPVGSRLGVKYAVESADNSKVKLAGVELALADDFHPMSRRIGDIAVWIVTKGRLPLTGESYKAPSGERKEKQGGAARVRGGMVEGTLNDRQLLATNVEGEFDRCMRQDRCHSHNPYLGKVVSLLNFLKARSPDTLTMVLPLLDFDPCISFYLLLEPYKTTGEFLIQDSLLFGDGAWNATDAYGSAVKEYESFFGMMAGQSADSPYVFRDRAAVAAQIDKVRQSIGSSQSGRQGPQLVIDAYTTFISQNAVQGMGPVLPDSTIRALGGAKKLWQDEFRFVVHAALQEMRAMPYSTDTFASIVRDLRTRRQGNDYMAELELVDLKTNVAPRDALLALMKFVNSTDFLYVPATPETVGGAWGSMDPTDWEVYNRNAVALADLRRTTGMVRSSGLSPQALQELQIYTKTYGSLPPEVLALAGK